MLVEWVKARAHMMRWKEELLIVQEEMRRVLAYQQWKATWWKECNSQNSDPATVSGISGYAHKQATICIQMAEQCALYWLPHLKEKGIVPSWASYYGHLPEVLDRLAGMPLEEDLEDAVLDIEGAEDETDLEDNGLDSEEREDDYFFDYSD